MEKDVALSPSEITQFAEKSQTRLISQLTNCISRFLRNLLKYFKGARILHYNDRIISASGVTVSTNFDLNLNDSESVILLFALSLQN